MNWELREFGVTFEILESCLRRRMGRNPRLLRMSTTRICLLQWEISVTCHPLFSRPSDLPREVSFFFRNVSQSEVATSILKIKSNAVGLDGIPISFVRIFLPVILPCITHVFNQVLTKSVQIEGFLSSFLPIKFGILQGSVQGRLPINDCCVLRYSRPHMFADVFQNYIQSSVNDAALAECMANLNEDLVSITGWASRNELFAQSVYVASYCDKWYEEFCGAARHCNE